MVVHIHTSVWLNKLLNAVCVCVHVAVVGLLLCSVHVASALLVLAGIACAAHWFSVIISLVSKDTSGTASTGLL